MVFVDETGSAHRSISKKSEPQYQIMAGPVGSPQKWAKFVDSGSITNFVSASALHQVRMAPRFSAFQRKRGIYRCSSIIMSRAIKIAATDNVIAKNRPSMLVSNGHVGTAETF